ncbi:putative trans-sialidase, Group II [Trypanosoma cruzi]|uniref:Trans-sialidase, putative n=2 Tax=Trypanosoma cruzi TaxID=5693 RepID=Q4DGR6_TRYCC|nr:trans-sialidase, putative [Trypanosoma cruzi]EAN91717.1 trans-sialidase, putative [Trypanosoma cruzi]PWU99909.1 putative trans-sialidase, Group II [Trypanosoma cruzi]RNC36857.1 surface protein-2 [Trypanosoma cruzi]|eukprot:XP_813568.1 trans-sialidase [Trypanosoma cruzi strain CL Brener]
MLSRVAAVKAPRPRNRRRVTGSSGRRRDGRESEPQRPHMSRRVFASAVLLLLVVIMCCNTGGAAAVVQGNSGDAQLLQWVDIFVPEKTQVLPKEGSKSEVKKASAAPSLVSAGGVMVAFAESLFGYNIDEHHLLGIRPYEIVAGYIKAAESWPSIVAEVNAGKWRAHTVFGSRNGSDRVCFLCRPTAVAKDNKVFLLVGSDTVGYYSDDDVWVQDGWDIKLVEGVATQSTDGRQNTLVSWAQPKSLLKHIPNHTRDQLRDVVTAGGSGVLMQNGTLVFPLVVNGEKYPFSSITYSTDNGNNWVFPESISPVGCLDPRITEWEKGHILMIVDCVDGQTVYESRDMGKTWTEAIGTLSSVWVRSQPGFRWDEGLRVGALITATIEGVKVMLYTQRGYASGKNRANALYVWVTDNNRTFHVGPLFVENNVNETLANALLYSDGALHLSRESIVGTRWGISLARLTEELNAIRSVLSNWARLDAFFSKSSTPTAGLVAVLSDEANDGTWVDDYRCVNASVTKAAKVKNGFKFTGPGSRATWPVNSREDNNQYGFVNHDFTIVATVVIHQVPKESTPLLGAGLGDGSGKKIIGLSYSMIKTWETVFDGTTKAQKNTWELGREYEVALILQDGHKGSVYVDGVIVGSSEAITTLETQGHEITHFYFGGDEGDSDSNVTVTNVFLYNRPLNSTEIRALKGRAPVSTRGPETQVEGMATTEHVAAVPGPVELPAAPGRTTMERATTTEHAAAVSFTSAGSGMQPLLFLLGLWGFAAA